VTAAHYRLVFPDERPPEDGDADVRITDGTVVLVLGDGDVLRVPFGLVISSGPADGFALRIALAGGAQIELSRLGRMRTQLLAELRDGQAGATAAAAAAAAGQPEVFTATGRDGPVEVRVYDDVLLITGATGSERISFSFITGVALTSYVVTVTVAGGEPVTVPGLGRRAGELADLLAARRADARVRTASFLGELLPGLDPMTLRQMATLLRDGVAVPTAALDAIAPGTAGALLQKATVPARREAVAELSRRTALAIGFRQIGSARRAAVGTSAWHDPAAVPHIGAHESPGGSFGPGVLGMLAAETIAAGAGPGWLGGFPGGTYPFPGLFPGGSYLFSGGYAGFRMAGATIDHGQQHSMTPRPDVTRGRLTPATEDLTALTAQGAEPTVLAFVLGRSTGDRVVFEVVSRPEPMTFVFSAAGPDGLAAINRALDATGFQPPALDAGALDAGARGAGPLAGSLAGQIAHDADWSSRLDALLGSSSGSGSPGEGVS